MADRTDEILVHLEYLRKGQDATNTHLASLNGRVGKSERDIAVLQDRANEARDIARREARKSGGVWGAVGMFSGGVLAAVYQHFGGKP